ncbi:MAG TPA: CHAT domain-containing tetratricopeptide repeat protein [Thermoanaerobaculia bacterium]|nr:CHAT domain-containing tetratricopeptide repeat protein [Thermoanaerobaculia bacterium]
MWAPFSPGVGAGAGLRPLAWAILGSLLLAAAPVPPALLAGTPVERDLAPGETQTYRVELAAGHAWRIAVEQRGIDVELAATGPDGRRVVVDGPFDRQGTETLLVEPAAAAGYAVEVVAREPAPPPGHYEIRLDELPSATEADRHRLAAEEAMSRAGERYREGTPARRQALAEYQRAVGEWRLLGDRRQEARALYAAAVLSRLVDDARDALKTAESVLPLWRALGDPLWEAATLNEIGLDRLQTGATAEARTAFEQAVALQRRIGDRYGEGASTSNLCVTDLAKGELRAGLACYEGALPALREVKAEALAASALLNVGRVWDLLGEPDQALDRYRQAGERMQATGDHEGEARTLNFIGLLHQELGDNQEALADFGTALEIFRASNNRRWQAFALHNTGLVYQGLGEWPRAASAYEEALRLRREVGDRREEAATLTNLGQVYAALCRAREALDCQQKALALRRESGDRLGEAVTLTQAGRAALVLADLPAARSDFDRAVEILHAAGSRVDESDALRGRGEAELASGEPARALPSLEEALRLARATGHQPSEAQAELRVAQAERRLGRLADARTHAGAAVEILETLRTRIGSADLRASFSALRHQAYELDLDLLMESHRAEPAAGWDRVALETGERARARTLVELLNEGGIDVHQGVDPALLERRTSLLRRLSAKTERSLREHPKGEDERAALEEERVAVLRDLDAVEAAIRERSPAYAALVQPQPLRAAEIQALLDPGTLLLAYALGDERSYLWAVTRERIDSFELPARARVEALARKVNEELSRFDVDGRRREAADAAALGRLLLGPVAARLGGQRLVVVPDGALEYIPFGVLPQPDGDVDRPVSLLEGHEVVDLPSASALAVLRRTLASRPPAAKPLALFADPVFDRRDPRVAAPGRSPATGEPAAFERLPASRQEAEAIAALAPAGGSLVALDFDAALPRVLGDRLSGYRVVHFATHGVIDAERPALSGLALSMVDAAGRPQEGFLHLHDIYNLKLDADLVVLSGCRTALGREVRGEGLIGLARGFQYAGAPRVIASLWPVEDLATAALMGRFYRALWSEKLTPAAALREAQLWVRQQRRWRDPYFWAGFVLEGDWR